MAVYISTTAVVMISACERIYRPACSISFEMCAHFIGVPICRCSATACVLVQGGPNNQYLQLVETATIAKALGRALVLAPFARWTLDSGSEMVKVRLLSCRRLARRVFEQSWDVLCRVFSARSPPAALPLHSSSQLDFPAQSNVLRPETAASTKGRAVVHARRPASTCKRIQARTRKRRPSLHSTSPPSLLSH
eukprot:1865352-Pleurochrysis_carterae.AAC.1